MAWSCLNMLIWRWRCSGMSFRPYWLGWICWVSQTGYLHLRLPEKQNTWSILWSSRPSPFPCDASRGSNSPLRCTKPPVLRFSHFLIGSPQNTFLFPHHSPQDILFRAVLWNSIPRLGPFQLISSFCSLCHPHHTSLHEHKSQILRLSQEHQTLFQLPSLLGRFASD